MERYRKGIILTIGLVVTITLLCVGLPKQNDEPVEGMVVKDLVENELLLKYKSTIPMVTAPLYIIAKGMKLAE